MVDLTTWDRLTTEEQREFDRLLPSLVEAIVNSRAGDGSEFASLYRVDGEGDIFYITDGAEILGAIKHRSRALIEALFKEAAMNYGR